MPPSNTPPRLDILLHNLFSGNRRVLEGSVQETQQGIEEIQVSIKEQNNTYPLYLFPFNHGDNTKLLLPFFSVKEIADKNLESNWRFWNEYGLFKIYCVGEQYIIENLKDKYPRMYLRLGSSLERNGIYLTIPVNNISRGNIGKGQFYEILVDDKYMSTLIIPFSRIPQNIHALLSREESRNMTKENSTVSVIVSPFSALQYHGCENERGIIFTLKSVITYFKWSPENRIFKNKI